MTQVAVATAKIACKNWEIVCLADAHAGVASWVQAIGAIGAIVATALIARLSTRESRRQVWKSERSFLGACKHAFNSVAYPASRMEDALQRYITTPGHGARTHFHDLMRALAAFQETSKSKAMATLHLLIESPLERWPDAALFEATRRCSEHNKALEELSQVLTRMNIEPNDDNFPYETMARLEIEVFGLNSAVKEGRSILKRIEPQYR